VNSVTFREAKGDKGTLDGTLREMTDDAAACARAYARLWVKLRTADES
jgi:hypothetical protein